MRCLALVGINIFLEKGSLLRFRIGYFISNNLLEFLNTTVILHITKSDINDDRQTYIRYC